jgi:hypothetical protein
MLKFSSIEVDIVKEGDEVRAIRCENNSNDTNGQEEYLCSIDGDSVQPIVLDVNEEGRD